MVAEFKAYLVQSCKKNEKITHQPHLFILIDTVGANGDVNYHVIMDKQQLNARKAFVVIGAETLFPRLEILFTQPSVQLVSHLVESLKYCDEVITNTLSPTWKLNEVQMQQSFVDCKTTKSGSDKGNLMQEMWTATMFDLTREYKMNSLAI
ncbi:unnamed protein product [Thelazia callipaeda]|uniref:VWFA domain-containing protein n=1 Tax=Thelazia callipaeda TaxID=103827 RepID=A0A0N5CTP9_THECL|nr:unnamed protein product [Thelazia callipaeda]